MKNVSYGGWYCFTVGQAYLPVLASDPAISLSFSILSFFSFLFTFIYLKCRKIDRQRESEIEANRALDRDSQNGSDFKWLQQAWMG